MDSFDYDRWYAGVREVDLFALCEHLCETGQRQLALRIVRGDFEEKLGVALPDSDDHEGWKRRAHHRAIRSAFMADLAKEAKAR